MPLRDRKRKNKPDQEGIYFKRKINLKLKFYKGWLHKNSNFNWNLITFSFTLYESLLLIVKQILGILIFTLIYCQKLLLYIIHFQSTHNIYSITLSSRSSVLLNNKTFWLTYHIFKHTQKWGEHLIFGRNSKYANMIHCKKESFIFQLTPNKFWTQIIMTNISNKHIQYVHAKANSVWCIRIKRLRVFRLSSFRALSEFFVEIIVT